MRYLGRRLKSGEPPPAKRPALESALADCFRNERRRSAKLSWWIACILAVLALAGALFGSRALLTAHAQRGHNSDAAGSTLPYTIDEQIGQPVAMELGQYNRGGGSFNGGQLKSRITPDYPDTALREGRGGKVIGTIVVNPAGVVEEVKISSGDPVLAGAVQRAVGRWRYAPFQLNNRAVTVAIPVQVAFRIPRPANQRSLAQD